MANIKAVVTAYNRADYVSVCLKSLVESLEEGLDVTVVLIDNGSSDNTSVIARSFGDRVRVIRNEENRPISYITNQGVEAALEDSRTEYIFLLNDDTSVLPGCVRRLADACAAHPDSLLTPLQLKYKEPHDIDDGAYDAVQQMRPLIEDAILGRPIQDVYSIPMIIGAGLFARREVYEHIGGYDELFDFYGPDTDFCNRALYLGYQLLLVPQAHLLHAHGRFFSVEEEGKQAWLKRWRLKLQSRFVLRLKNPHHPLWLNYLSASWFTLTSCLTHLVHLWPPGVFATIKNYVEILVKYPAIRRAYGRDFNPARRLK